MLRFVLLILFAANLGYAAWGQGWLTAVGWGPGQTSEPWRLEKQMRPEAVQLLNGTASPTPVADAAPIAASATDATEPAPLETETPAPATAATEIATQCLEAGPFTQEETKTLRSALRAQELPWDSYELRTQEVAGRWMVYLGKFPSPELLARQRASLRAQGIDTDRAGGNLEPGLSLGRFSSEEAATRELTRLLRSGVRGARVVQERATTQVFTLRLPAVTAAQQAKLAALAPALGGKALEACAE
ncbi:SPOR domain-containing protein [Comamonas nitrativorans]|uniref:SPOR domain-containing protein n=1 Tax=Comamonas nitrativorans TaxID=108437 RepID=A0ABV9H0V4_9BURK